jgi:hypothetical protein
VLAWDSASDLRVIPNIYSETVVVDSSPALWDLTRGPEETVMLLLVLVPSLHSIDIYFLISANIASINFPLHLTRVLNTMKFMPSVVLLIRGGRNLEGEGGLLLLHAAHCIV